MRDDQDSYFRELKRTSADQNLFGRAFEILYENRYQGIGDMNELQNFYAELVSMILRYIS